MSIMGGVIIYVNLWMVILFMVLPFGIKNQVDSANYQKGTDPGAPVEAAPAEVVAEQAPIEAPVVDAPAEAVVEATPTETPAE